MKSTDKALAERGYVEKGAENTYSSYSFQEKIILLKSSVASERTIGARLLAGDPHADTVPSLIEALKKEKKLYSKMAICDALISTGLPAVSALIQQLGKIGNNQHKTVPQEKFNKKSYPLPRDIISRTLSRIGTTALPLLTETLNSKDINQLSEVIDTIGYICFYDYSPSVYKDLISCFAINNESNLIRWKIIRALSGFPESKKFLEERLKHEKDNGIQMEIERSLNLINKK